MFWRVAGFTQPSPVETILDKDNFTLEELLDEDDLIQECKSLNGRLVNFLRERKTVEALLRYLVQNPDQAGDAASSDADSKQRFKYPYAACEVFCCEVDGIFTTLLSDDELLELLFSLLEQEGSLHCVTAGYFARVVGTLLFRRTTDIMKYLESHQSVLHRLIHHLDTTSIAEIVVRLVGAEEQTGMYLAPTQVSWLTETDLMALLLERLGPGFPPDAQKHAAEILAAVARSQLSPLVRVMSAPDCLRVLFERAFTSEGASSVQALDVCIALLEPRPGPVDGYGNSPTGGARGSPSQEARQALQAEAVAGMSPYSSRLLGMLDDSHAPEPQETPFGVLSPPLGSARLKAVETVAALVRISDDAAERVLMGAGLIPRCLELFVRFPFNNLLHHQVTAMLMGALESGSDALMAYVFETAHVLTWLVEAPTEVRPPPRPGAAADAPPRPALRAGYMGHITYIANKLLEAGMQSEQMRAYMDAHGPWQEYVEEVLKPRNGVENVMKWACGRPLASDLTVIGSEGDEAEQMMDLEPLPPLTAAKPASPGAATSSPRYFTGAAAHEAADMDGADLELRDAGVAFEALHLAPRLAAGGPGVGDSDSESSSSDSSGADSSGDSSDEDEAGGLDLLSPLPPGKGTDHPRSSPVRVKSLDDDDVVLVAPFDEEVAGEGSGSPEFPLANDELHAAEVNHNHVGHHTAHSSNERFRAQTNKGMQDDFPVDRHRAATGASSWGLLHEAPESAGSSALGNGPESVQRERPKDAVAADDREDMSAAARIPEAAPGSERGACSSSNGSDLVVSPGGLVQTPSQRSSPIAQARAADLARVNGSQDASRNAEATAAQPGRSVDSEEAWQPAWPTLEVSESAPAEQERLGHGVPLEAPGTALPAAGAHLTAGAKVLGTKQTSQAEADAAAADPHRTPSRGGIAGGIAAQSAPRFVDKAALDAGVATTTTDSRDTAGDAELPPASEAVSARDGGNAETAAMAGLAHGSDAEPSYDSIMASSAPPEQPADVNGATLSAFDTASH